MTQKFAGWYASQMQLGKSIGAMVAAAAVSFMLEPLFPLGDWKWVIVAVIGIVVYAWSDAELRGRAIRVLIGPAGRTDDRQNDQLPAWKIPGARAKWFKLHEAACLLVEDEPSWPLPTQRSRDEYAVLCDAIRGEKLDDGEADDTLSYQYGWHEEDETVHLLELDRRVLRRYLYRNNRPIPDFLHERFDE